MVLANFLMAALNAHAEAALLAPAAAWCLVAFGVLQPGDEKLTRYLLLATFVAVLSAEFPMASAPRWIIPGRRNITQSCRKTKTL